MNIGIVTTSRADFGIYLPLLNKLKETKGIGVFIFAGGMHTSEFYGNSYKLIEEYGFEIESKFANVSSETTPNSLNESSAQIIKSCSNIWQNLNVKLDFLFVLGDRFEMHAAATSAIPFNIKLAHLHGGEVTLGAIDNKYRNSITTLSDIHFTSHTIHSNNVKKMLQSDEVYTVGSLGLDSAAKTSLMTIDEFDTKYDVDINEGFVLVTFHPETVSLENGKKADELIEAFKLIPLKILCTLPNADTEGSIVREKFLEFEQEFPSKIVCFENLGQKGYFSAMNYCKMMLGNTSSGIIESSYFKKWVINVGDRQKGRLAGNNVFHSSIERNEIISIYNSLKNKAEESISSPFGFGDTSQKIIDILYKIKNKSE